jgi:hypothetical protein
LLALASRRALWTDTLRGSDATYIDVWTGAPGEPEQLVEELSSDTAYGDGDVVSAIAGDGVNLVYSVVTLTAASACISGGSCDLSVANGRMMLVSPKLKVRSLPNVPPAAYIALAGDLIAIVPVLPDPVRQGLLPVAHGFAVFRITSGNLVARTVVAAPIVGLALSPTTVAVLTRDRSGAAITRYSAATGRPLDTTHVAGSASDVSVSGSTVVYKTGRTIRVLGRPRPLAVADGEPVGVSVDGTRVAWADSPRARVHVHSVQLRANARG